MYIYMHHGTLAVQRPYTCSLFILFHVWMEGLYTYYAITKLQSMHNFGLACTCKSTALECDSKYRCSLTACMTATFNTWLRNRNAFIVMRNAEIICDLYSHAHIYSRNYFHHCLPWSNQSDVRKKEEHHKNTQSYQLTIFTSVCTHACPSVINIYLYCGMRLMLNCHNIILLLCMYIYIYTVH